MSETAVEETGETEVSGDAADTLPDVVGRAQPEAADERKTLDRIPKGTDRDEGSNEKKDSGQSGEDTKGYAVVLKTVSKHYGDKVNVVMALNRVNLKLKRGTRSAVMGPSGSGKSTLINMIGSLDVPTDGEVIIDGINLENMTARELTQYRREKVGFVFQTFNLLPNLTALENVELPMEFLGKGKEERLERAERLLKSVKMERRTTHLPGDLSGGEKQRVAIARALANKPSIILADEPTGNLDSKSGKAIIELLKGLAKSRNKTLIIVTHDQKIAEMTDRIITIEDGEITEIRDVGDTNTKLTITRDLDLPRHLVDKLFSAGYDDLEKILDISEAELMVKNFKKKDKKLIMDQISKYKRDVGGNICPRCSKEIPIKGVKFCPFCSAEL